MAGSTANRCRPIGPAALLTTVMAFAAACGGAGSEAPATPLAEHATSPTPEPALRVVVLGDSLAAGFGLPSSNAFPAVLEGHLRETGLEVEVVNAGVSGDTTAGGLSRLDWVLQRPVDVLVVELGGNDALRGQDLANTERNLREIVRRGRAAGVEVVLLGMDVPINYGPDYAASFAALYPRIADEEGAVLVPGFVRELGSNPELLQPDGLHPTAEGQRRLAETLTPVLTTLLDAE